MPGQCPSFHHPIASRPTVFIKLFFYTRLQYLMQQSIRESVQQISRVQQVLDSSQIISTNPPSNRSYQCHCHYLCLIT